MNEEKRALTIAAAVLAVIGAGCGAWKLSQDWVAVVAAVCTAGSSACTAIVLALTKKATP